MATPIRAHCAAAWSSALRMSGRRRSRSAGCRPRPSSGACGMAERPRARPSRLRGGRPSRVQSALPGLPQAGLEQGNAWPRWLRSWVSACCTSRSLVAPPWKRTSAMRRLSRLDLDVVAGDAQALLDGADQHVDARHVGREAHQGVVVGGDGPEEVRILGLDRAPEPAREVELPGGGGAHLDLRSIQTQCRRAAAWRCDGLRFRRGAGTRRG